MTGGVWQFLAWFAVATVWTVVASFIGGAVVALLRVARAARRVICRDLYRADFAFSVVIHLGLLAISIRFFGWIAPILVASGLGFGHFLAVSTSGEDREVERFRRWRAHRRHDVDCEFGPKERGRAARLRLRSWRKVALRPGLAAS